MDFAPAIIAKLEEQAKRHAELTELMSDPEVASDSKRFPEILKEHGRLTSAAELYRLEEPVKAKHAKGDEHIHQFANLSSFAEQMLVHEHAVVKVREDMPMDRAAVVG